MSTKRASTTKRTSPPPTPAPPAAGDHFDPAAELAKLEQEEALATPAAAAPDAAPDQQSEPDPEGEDEQDEGEDQGEEDEAEDADEEDADEEDADEEDADEEEEPTRNPRRAVTEAELNQYDVEPDREDGDYWRWLAAVEDAVLAGREPPPGPPPLPDEQ